MPSHNRWLFFKSYRKNAITANFKICDMEKICDILTPDTLMHNDSALLESKDFCQILINLNKVLKIEC